MKFQKITRKEFVNQLTASDVIFCGGGFTTFTVEDDSRADIIINHCEGVDIDNAVYSTIKSRSNSIVRIDKETGEASYLDFKKGQRCYNYGNIYVIETPYEESERISQVIYMCV